MPDKNQETLISTKKRPDLGSVTVILVTLILFVFLSVSSDTFFKYDNIYSILYGVSFQFIASIGFTLLLIMGEIDLSVGAIYAFSGMFAANLMMKHSVAMAPAIIISIIVCTLIGLLTGFIIVKLRINSMMVTIATQTIIFGLASRYIRILVGLTYPKAFRQLSRVSIGKIYLTIIVMIVLMVVLEIMLKKSTIFRKMYYVGENQDTAKLYGIKSERIKMWTFALSAFCASVGGVLANARVTYADSTLGQGLEFTILTAAVLGGASLYGGKGSIMATGIGLIFLSMISNGMVIFNIEPLLSSIIVGTILIIAVFIDSRINKES